MEIFARMMDGPAAGKAESQTIMIDATYLKTHRTALSLRLKIGSAPPDRSYQRRYEYQGPCLTDQNGRPLDLFMTARQVTDYSDAVKWKSSTGLLLPQSCLAFHISQERM